MQSGIGYQIASSFALYELQINSGHLVQDAVVYESRYLNPLRSNYSFQLIFLHSAESPLQKSCHLIKQNLHLLTSW